MNIPAHIFKCKHCQTPLGVTVGVTLHVGAVEFDKPVSLRCVKCQRATFWAPAKVETVKAA
jgi:RNase P subunit RPR2